MCCIGCPWSHQGTWKQLFDPWIPVPISNVSCQCYFESSLESRSLTLSDVFCKRVWFSKAKLGVTLTVGRCRCHLSPGTGRAKRFGLSSGIDRNVAVDFQFATYSASWHVCESLICEAIDGFLPYSTEKPTIDMISKRPQGGKAVMCIPYSEDIEPISTLSRPSH